jgi:hypothetical protein
MSKTHIQRASNQQQANKPAHIRSLWLVKRPRWPRGRAVKSGSPFPWPPPALLGLRVGIGRRPLFVVSWRCPWWFAAGSVGGTSDAARLVSARCGWQRRRWLGSCWSVYMDCTSSFHQFRLLVMLVSAWSLTWYQSLRSRVQVLAFAIYYKIIVTPRCQCIGLPITSDHVQGLLCLPLSLYTWWLVCHTWVRVLKCIRGLY